VGVALADAVALDGGATDAEATGAADSAGGADAVGAVADCCA
jgi:hypothetical protein